MTGALGRTWIVAAAIASGIVLRPPALVGAGAMLFLLRRAPAATVAALVFTGMALGGAAAQRHEARRGVLAAEAEGVPRCDVDGVLREHLGGLGSLVSVRRAECGGVAIEGGTVAAPPLDAHPGAPIRARGRLVPLEDDSFDTARRRLGAEAAFAPAALEASMPTSPPAALAARIRTGLRRATSPLDATEAALLRGLTIGDTRDLPAADAEYLRRAGLSHLVAVSGSNVAVVLGAVAAAARRLRAAARVALAAGGLALFVLVVGPEPSVLRAAAMGGAGLAAVIVGTRAVPLHVLALAVVTVLALRPALLFSAGLQLSVAATAGIILWAPRITARLALPPPVAVALGVTVAAQVAVVPVLVLTFGGVPVAGLPANLVAAPAVAPATVLGFAAALLGALDPGLAALPARLAAPLAAWIIGVGRHFGAPEWATITLPPAFGWAAAAALAAAALRTLRTSSAVR
ncbi:MAG TPA: ComEC/Rec2 family competence protein [Actinomycetota bacterium]|nr:ComEC/Rec2 family competence protein [Actinomycetota bacterium]